MQSIFGTDGIRGKFNKEITFSLAYKVAFALGLNLNTAANALVLVDGYFKSNGTYVESHWRTSPDGVCWNNFSGC